MLNLRQALVFSFFLFSVGVRADVHPIAVLGTVTGPEGKPVAGATAELLPFVDNHERNRLLLLGRSGPPAAAVTQTDSAGRFLLEAPAGLYQVVLRAPGLVPMQYFLLPATRPVELPPAVLPRDAGTRIELFDDDDRPIPGAAVYAVSSETEATRESWRRWTKDGWRALTRLGRTGADGAARLPRLADEWLDVSIFLPGKATPYRVREVEGVRLLLEPPPANPRTLEVVDSRGRPIAGVLVVLGTPAWPAGTTDEKGRLTVSGWSWDEPLRMFLMTSNGRRLDAWLEPADAKSAVTFTFPEARRLAGRLVDSATQRPVAGALVWPHHDPGTFAVTGDGGEFELYAPQGQGFWVQAEADAFAPQAYWIDSRRSDGGEVRRLALVPAAAIGGRVVDGEGKPLAGVLLTARPVGSSSSRNAAFRLDPAQGRAASDARGHFTLAPLEPGGAYELTAIHRRFIATTVTLGGLEPGSRRQTRIELSASRAGVGRVVDLAGRPVRDAAVAVRPAVKKSSRKRLRRLEIPGDPAAPAQPSLSASTDGQGRFEIPELPARKLDLLAWREGFAPMVVWGLEVPSGKDAADLGTLALEPAVAIEGVALDSEENPLEGVSIWAYERPVRSGDVDLERLSKDAADAISAAGGRFRVDDLRAGARLDLVAFRSGFAPAVLRRIPAPNLESAVVVLEPSARLDGRVVDPEDRPIAGAEVVLQAQEPPAGSLAVRRTEAGDECSVRSDDAGHFAIDNVRSGSYEVVVSAEGFQPEPPLPVEIAPNAEIEELVVTLELGATLEGRTLTADGEPVAGVRIVVGDQAAVSDPAGHYRAAGIPPGLQTVEALHEDHNRLLAEAEIEPGRNELDLTFDPGWQVSGRVVDPDGQPLADASVHLRSQAWRNSRHYRTASGESGRFELPRVAAGEYVLEAEKPEYVKTEAAERVVVDDDSVEGLELTLARGAVISGRILGLEFDDLATVQIEARGDAGRLHAGSVDFAGSYEIRDLAAGDWLVVATLQDGGRQARAWATLEPGSRRARRDVEFEEGLALTGQVLYDLTPLPAAAVAVVGRDVAAERQVATDYQGRFRIEDLRPGQYRVTVSSSRELLVHNQDVDLRTGRDVVIEIATSRVSGTVTSGGEPLGDALVALRQMQGGEGSSLFTVGTNTEGFFTVARLTEGSYQVTVRKDGYATVEETLAVTASVDLPDLRYELPPTRGLDLVVGLASGRIPPYATVAVIAPSGHTLLSESRSLDAEGRVRFPTVPAGRWEILVSAPAAAARSLTVDVPEDPVVLILSEAGRLRIRVPGLMEPHLMATLTLTDPSGQPLRSLDPVTATPASAWPVAGGTALVEGVPAGPWVARVESSDGRSWSGTLVAQETGETTVTLD